jgi:hypothetical protein
LDLLDEASVFFHALSQVSHAIRGTTIAPGNKGMPTLGARLGVGVGPSLV